MRWVSYHPNGGFLKWGYPQIIHFNRIVPYKPTILGTPNLGTQIYNLTSLENSSCLAPDVFLPQALEVLLRNVNSLELKKLVPDTRPRHRGSWCLGCWHGGWCPCFHGSLLFGGRLSRLAEEIGKAQRPVFTLLFFLIGIWWFIFVEVVSCMNRAWARKHTQCLAALLLLGFSGWKKPSEIDKWHSQTVPAKLVEASHTQLRAKRSDGWSQAHWAQPKWPKNGQ